jgi:hypothetical protein
MFSLDDRPAVPQTPVFRADMERFLLSAARGESRRPQLGHRTLIGLAAGGAAAAVALGAAVTFNGTRRAPGHVEASPVHVHLVDFSVDTNPGGTVTVTLSNAQIMDPDALRQALAQAGIPAKVTPDSFCYNPVPNEAALMQAVAFNSPRFGEAADVVITPSKLPAGATLAIGYAHPPAGGPGKPGFHLLTAGAPVICSTNPPPVSKGPVPAPPPGAKEPTRQTGSSVPPSTS